MTSQQVLARPRQLLNKVPEVTIYFWIIKVLATTVGETAADFLSTTLNLGLTGTSYVMSALFALSLVVQLDDVFHATASVGRSSHTVSTCAVCGNMSNARNDSML